MTPHSLPRAPGLGRGPRARCAPYSLALTIGLLAASACASGRGGGAAGASAGGAPSPAADMSTTAPSPDPRVGLHAGWFDAGEAIWNLDHLSNTKPSEKFINPSTPGDRRLVNSDLAFLGNYVIQGNYSGMQIWDMSNPRKPTLKTAYVCPGSQSDVSVYKNLLFVSAEATSGRIDCGLEGVKDTVSKERARGIRIYDISDVTHPRSIKIVQTCRGSHTNTLVVDPNDKDNVYVYVSGSAPVRSSEELPGCSGGKLDENPNTALFRIEVIKVPVAHPEDAAIASSPRIFNDLSGSKRHGESAADSAQMDAMLAKAGLSRSVFGRLFGMGPTQCHDITAYPAVGLAGGACSGYGLLLDIHDPVNPTRIGAVVDSNMAAWHSVTFNNAGTKIIFSDEWGGGSQPRCRATDKREWGADAIYTIENRQMIFHSYFKMPAPQTVNENCVAHNGSLIPIPGRDIMVQGWYQGGISVFEFTDPDHPREIAFFDRGPMDSTKLVDGGFWSAYWYNGYIVGSDISRGLDIFQLKPSGFLSKNEIEAARSVHLDYLNVQGQPKFVWPASFSLARAYLDQLVRNDGISHEESTRLASALDRAERLSSTERSSALGALTRELEQDVASAADPHRVRALAETVRDLARASG